MPKGKNALNFLFILLMSSGLLTAAPPFSSLTTESFNNLLRSEACEGTTALRNGLNKVVIDAGHGGKDPGGMGKNSMEKDIALNIARLLAIGIRTNYPDVEVILTRSDDTFIPLYERAEIANKAGADLFISIHANIMPGSSATYGTETFVMGQHVAEQNLRVAKRENASILLESGDVTTNYGYDPNSPEGHILMSMQQHAFLDQSILFAMGVEEEFAKAGRKSRGVKQAGFVVLKATTMPAVLVETGFMSNPDEEVFLLSDSGQQKLATSLLIAFKRYHQTVTGTPMAYDDRQLHATALRLQLEKASAAAGLEQNSSTTPPTLPEVTETQRTAPPRASVPRAAETVSIFSKEVDLDENRAHQWTARGISPSPVVYQPVAPAPRPFVPQPSYSPQTYSPLPYSPQPATDNRSVLGKEVTLPTTTAGRVIPGATVLSAYAPIDSYAIVEPDSTSPGNYRFPEAKQRKTQLKAGQVDLRTIPDEQLTYGVQVFATKRDLDLTVAPWNSVPYPIVKITEKGLNKYQIRNLPNAAAAAAAKQRVKAAGIKESMVVAYLNGKRLPQAAVNFLLTR